VEFMDGLPWNWIVGGAIALVLVLGYKYLLALCGVIIIPDDSVGVVTKKFVLFGGHRSLPPGRIVAGGGADGNHGSLVDVLLANVLVQQRGGQGAPKPGAA